MDDQAAAGEGGPGPLPEPARAGPVAGGLVTETLAYDGGRPVTAYVPPDPPEAVVFDPERFAAHEQFFVNDVRRRVRSRFGVALPSRRTAVFGVSAGGELALALGLRHPGIYGAVFCGSPGAGYKPPGVTPGRLPRVYLVAGTLEPFFLGNASRWAAALRDARTGRRPASRPAGRSRAARGRRQPGDPACGAPFHRSGPRR